jgi:hypothetical protein
MVFCTRWGGERVVQKNKNPRKLSDWPLKGRWEGKLQVWRDGDITGITGRSPPSLHSCSLAFPNLSEDKEKRRGEKDRLSLYFPFSWRGGLFMYTHYWTVVHTEETSSTGTRVTLPLPHPVSMSWYTHRARWGLASPWSLSSHKCAFCGGGGG